MRHWYRRRWDEVRGDHLQEWGGSTWWFEVDEHGRPSRQIEVYDHGPTLRYGPEHESDEYGQLGSARFDDHEDWASWAVPREEFESAWSAVT